MYEVFPTRLTHICLARVTPFGGPMTQPIKLRKRLRVAILVSHLSVAHVALTTTRRHLFTHLCMSPWYNAFSERQFGLVSNSCRFSRLTKETPSAVARYIRCLSQPPRLFRLEKRFRPVHLDSSLDKLHPGIGLASKPPILFFRVSQPWYMIVLVSHIADDGILAVKHSGSARSKRSGPPV